MKAANSIYFSVFRPKDDTKLRDLFHDNYTKTLEVHNLKGKVKSANNYWFEADNVYVILAHSKKYDLIFGGLRIEIKKSMLLPSEKLLGRIEPKISSMINTFKTQGVAEVCSLWKNKLIINNPLDVSVLIMTAIPLMKQIDIKTVVFLTSKPISRMVEKIGVKRVIELGDKGVFEFIGNHIAIFEYFVFPESLKNGNEREVNVITKLTNSSKEIISEKYGIHNNTYIFDLAI